MGKSRQEDEDKQGILPGLEAMLAPRQPHAPPSSLPQATQDDPWLPRIAPAIAQHYGAPDPALLTPAVPKEII